MEAVKHTNYHYPLLFSGKVRDIYGFAPDQLLIATSDRISAMDEVLDPAVPGKGEALNAMTLFWMRMMEDIVPNHIIREFDSRSVIARKTETVPFECIVRGYITGSGWKDYRATGEICGHRLPEGLIESQKLPEPIFTPSTKAVAGEHDENISVGKMREKVGDLADEIAEKAIAIYKRAAEYAEKKGIIIADTKFEFGLENGKLILIDEVLTPDSSRFWDKASYEPGKSQKSFDKQPLRDWIKAHGAKNIPEGVIAATSKRYKKAMEMLAK